MTSPTTAPGTGSASAVEADRCPGMLRPHQAADGAVVRIRLIGGRIPVAALAAVGAAARRYGDGTITLTSRGNLQLRGLSVDERGDADAGLVEAISAAGLLPSRTHERVRNVLVSPLTGIAGGHVDLRPAADELDRKLCRDRDLAELSGRFLFGLDDGRGDLSSQVVDLGVTAVDRRTARLRIGAWWGPPIAVVDAADTLIECARRFRSLAGNLWRIGDLTHQGREILPTDCPAEPVRSDDQDREMGVVAGDDGGTAGVVGIPLGRLDTAQLDTVLDVARQGHAATAGSGAADVVVTPDRRIVIPYVDPDAVRQLAAAGLIVDPGDPRRAVTACTGAPGCASAEGPTTAVARTDAVRETRSTGLPVHVVACERRCGAPPGSHLELLVTRTGLRRHLRPTGARTR